MMVLEMDPLSIKAPDMVDGRVKNVTFLLLQLIFTTKASTPRYFKNGYLISSLNLSFSRELINEAKHQQ